MRYGVLSDIHGNLEAFEAALSRLQKEKVEQYLFCGDIIGYGPDPEACVQLYKFLEEQQKAVGVIGNHDAIFSHPEMQAYFHADALEVLDWSKGRLSESLLRYISFLPEKIQEPSFTLVHGTPRDPIKEYFSTGAQFRNMLPLWQGQILFVGHTHIPFYMEGDAHNCRVHIAGQAEKVHLDNENRYVINPGSVGKPRNNDPRASFGVWDSQEQIFSFIREPYDYTKTIAKMAAAGLPEFLIDSLSIGI